MIDASCPACDPHPSHKNELPRLNRIVGQVEGVKKMIEANRYCPDILTQLRAARAALRTVENAILAAHLDQCVSDALAQGNPAERRAKIDELMSLFKRYDEA
jgi:DNA-binding FrmR family transcriptional regulator